MNSSPAMSSSLHMVVEHLTQPAHRFRARLWTARARDAAERFTLSVIAPEEISARQDVEAELRQMFLQHGRGQVLVLDLAPSDAHLRERLAIFEDRSLQRAPAQCAVGLEDVPHRCPSIALR